MSNLFQYKKFTMHSGGKSNFKIECDAITNHDYDTLAKLIAEKYNFKEVHGIPRGGVPFENSLKKYVTNDNNNLLIVDDVLTTGRSMEEAKAEFANHGYDEIFGIVVFSRGESKSWIKSLFQLESFFAENA